MIRKIKYIVYSTLIIILVMGFGIQAVKAQSAAYTVKGKVIESGTGNALAQVSISVTSTGVVADTDEKGDFSIEVPGKQSELIVYLPGYTKRTIYTNGREVMTISLVADEYKSMDDVFNKTLGTNTLKNEVYAGNTISANDMQLSNTTSFDQAMQGLAPGLQIIRQSGMPGEKTWLNVRGVNSMVARNEPLLIIDGMIHDYNYAYNGIMEGYDLNPMDIVDVDDIADISVMKGGNSFMGAAGSNGIIYLNTEQKSEASTLIKVSAYGGVAMTPKKLDVLNAGQFKNYFQNYLQAEGLSQNQMETTYPWLAGNGSDKFKYDNSTDWQKEIYQPAILQKYHIFLKGGDDIATYNISAGLINHGGNFDESKYNRFNLRVNGKINITDKFSLAPNVKLSLADMNITNLGPTYQRNPITSALMKPSIMAPNARDVKTGEHLPYLDDTGVLGVSNPVALVTNAMGVDRNYHFLSSVNAMYKFSEQMSIGTMVGINFNNARESIFIPDIGVVQIDSAANSPMDFVNEYRSTQNHTYLNYSGELSGNALTVNTGFRYVENSYKYNILIDLNTPSDDFKNLGQGSKYNYLRTATGDYRGLRWISYYGNGTYNIDDKYIFNANFSVDANSALNSKNRYNVYPSIGAAWRLTSEEFMSDSNIEDLKLRASVSQTGNMYSNVYDYSKLYYGEYRINNKGVLTRTSVPNEDLKIEKSTIANIGLDFTGKQQLANVHLDLYYSLVHNLIIEQSLPSGYGFTSFYDNGGTLGNMGLELSADYRKRFGDLVWTVGGNVTSNISSVLNLEFIDNDQKSIVTRVEGAEYVTQKGHAINMFYGYETNGIYQSNDEAQKMIGPKNRKMQAGDVKFVDQNGDGKINNADKTIIGNPNPIVYGGLFTSAAKKRWEVRAMFTYSVGNQLYNYVRYKGESMDTYANQLTSVLDRWTESNPGGILPRSSFGDPTGNTVFSDRWIEDGSYLKLKQLTISYSLPGSWLFSGAKVYVTASNLFTLTGYSGLDPETYYLNSPFYMGIDYGKLPNTRSFIVGVKLDL